MPHEEAAKGTNEADKDTVVVCLHSATVRLHKSNNHCATRLTVSSFLIHSVDSVLGLRSDEQRHSFAPTLSKLNLYNSLSGSLLILKL